MITDQDIKKLQKVFATKEELGGMREEMGDLRVELGEVNEKVDSIRVTLDAIAGGIQDLRTENSAGAVHLARLDR